MRNGSNHGPRDREGVPQSPKEAEGPQRSKYHKRGTWNFLDDDDDGAFHVPPISSAACGGKHGRTGGGGYPTSASARGGLDSLEASCWATNGKKMKKEIHKEQMQYQRQLEKEIGVKPPIRWAG